MPEQRFEKIKLVLSIVQTLAIVIAAGALVVNYSSYKDQHAWNRRVYGAELLGKFDTAVQPHREIIYKAVPALANDDVNSPPPIGTWGPLVAARYPGERKFNGGTDATSEVDAFELKSHLYAVFNYYEDLATAWEWQMAEENMLDDQVGHVILRWENIFGNFKEALKKANKDVAQWPALDRYVQHLQDKQRIPFHNASPTGVLTKQ